MKGKKTNISLYLRMCASNFDDVTELFSFGVDGIMKLLKAGQKGARYFDSNSNVHRSRKSVVRTLYDKHSMFTKHSLTCDLTTDLTFVDMIIRVHWFLAT